MTRDWSGSLPLPRVRRDELPHHVRGVDLRVGVGETAGAGTEPEMSTAFDQIDIDVATVRAVGADLPDRGVPLRLRLAGRAFQAVTPCRDTGLQRRRQHVAGADERQHRDGMLGQVVGLSGRLP